MKTIKASEMNRVIAELLELAAILKRRFRPVLCLFGSHDWQPWRGSVMDQTEAIRYKYRCWHCGRRNEEGNAMKNVKLLLIFILTTNILLDAPVVEALLVNAFGPHTVLVPVYRSASLEYCWGTEQFQGPTSSTAFGTITNANAGQPIPITIDPKNCQPRLEDVLIQAMRKPLQPWPIPFPVIQQQ